MGTDNTAALTRASRKLKELASDAISIPTTQELADRKSAELADVRRALDGIVKRQIAIETRGQRSTGDNTAVIAEKEKQLALIARLQDESGMLKVQLRAARPKPQLTPQQKMWADALSSTYDPYEKCKRGSPQQIEAAQQAVDALVIEYRMAQPTGNASNALTARLNTARLRLMALQGPPYPPYRPWASNETLKAARKELGFE